MPTDPHLIPRGQYRNDQRTVVPIGAMTAGDGIVNNLWLEADIYSALPGASTSMQAEVRPVGVAFSNSATTSTASYALKEPLLPTSRRGANLVYDTKNKRFILFGGYNGTTRFNEVWERSANGPYSRWHKLTPTGTAPTAKNLAAATFARGSTSSSVDKAYMIIWGGATPGDSNEMHVLDVSTPGGEAWTTVSQTNTPAARSYILQHMVSKQTATNTTDIYLFGGWGTTRTNDMLRCTFDVNTPGTVSWTILKANGAGGSPPGRSGTSMLYDAANDRIILTCGYTGSAYLSDVWQYAIATNTFTAITPSGAAPALRELASIAYDSVNQRAILIGGWQGVATTNRNDITQLSLTPGSETWTQIQSNSATNHGVLAFSSAGTAVDTDRNFMILTAFLGYDSTNKYTYAFDMNNTTLTAPMYGLTTTDFFRARDAPAYVFNPTRNELLFINAYSAMDDDGTITNGEHVSEIWAYNRTANTWRYAAKGPLSMPESEGALAIYDAANDRIIYFGGLTGTNQRTNDVWQLKADAFGMYKATKLSPAGTLPTPRWLMAGCYDAANQRIVLWGGQSASSVLGDTWQLTLTPGTETWTQLSPTGTAPTAAWQSSFAFDAANNRLFVHAGATNSASTTFTSQLFYLDISTASCSWTNTGVTGGIGARGTALGYDALNQRLVCFGGYDGAGVINTVRYTSTNSFTAWTTQSTGNTPAARRSSGYSVIDSTFIVSCGRPVTGTWFNDTHELNFTASPAVWSWTNKNPSVYQITAAAVTGLLNNASYHWQGWASTGSTLSAATSFGGNSESATDFIIGSGTGGNIKTYAGTWNPKPMKVWNGTTWVTKPVKVWNGTAWIQTDY